MSQVVDALPSWNALSWVVTQNMRDVVDRRYELLPELIAWFKSLAMFREAERDLMILKEPGPEDLSFHKAVLALLIGEGERLRGRSAASAGLKPNESGITIADFEAALDHLYDTQFVWHGELTQERKAEIFKLSNASVYPG
jgi:hypothetical protein